jgi:hypothetical protein
MALKITSFNFVKESELPPTMKNTELANVARELSDVLTEKPLQKGNAIKFNLPGAKKHTRFALQRKLQAQGHHVKLSGNNGEFHITVAPENGGKKKNK